MSDASKEQATGDSAASAPSPSPGAAAEPVPPPRSGTAPAPAAPRAHPPRPAAAGWLALLLAVVVAGVLLSPFWAPAMTLLLPWGAKPAQPLDALAQRVAALEARPAPPQVDLGPFKSAQAALAERVTTLEALTAALQRDAAAAAAKAALATLGQRLDAAEAQAAARVKSEDAAFDQLRRDMAERDAAAADLGRRLAALEQRVATEGAAGRRGAALLLALLEMREAVANARPFPAEYAAFEALAAGDADLAAAARPLAAAASSGVTSGARLRQGLADLADRIATVKPPPAGAEWWARALARLRGLVTIRRIDNAAKTGPEAALAKAQTALAEGDLAGAIAAVEKLTGDDAEAAQPWLAPARQRLAAETALARVQQIATARLGAAPSPAATTPGAAPGSTAPAPAQSPAAPKAPS